MSSPLLVTTVRLDPFEIGILVLAGLLAGTINALVGSGSLITFPSLLAMGFSPLVANVSNGVGLVFGSASAAVGYRRELVGQAPRIKRLLPPALAGGVVGALLLLVLPSRVFGRVVPVLVILAIVMVILQPRLTQRLAARTNPDSEPWWLWLGVFLLSIYGGYFGAAQGVILISLMAIALSDSLVRLNGLKNYLLAAVNGVSAVVYGLGAPVDWRVAGIVAVSSVVGGQLGAHVGRRLPVPILRALIVIAGLGAVVKLIAQPV